MLISNSVHESWREFLTREIIQDLEFIESKLGDNYTPPKDLILRFLSLDLGKIKVVILGQDPYPQEGVANGRAFQPSNLLLWNQPYRNNSIKNIVRLIYKEYVGRLVNYSSINWSTFNIKPPIEWFDSLERQGVLLLNTSLTCKIGDSNSHAYLWSNFSSKLIRFISNKNTDINWFLLGKSAQGNRSNILSGKVYNSPHPMMGTEEFFKSTCFKETMSIINWLG